MSVSQLATKFFDHNSPFKCVNGVSWNLEENFLKGRSRQFWSGSENIGYPKFPPVELGLIFLLNGQQEQQDILKGGVPDFEVGLRI